jgi:hypothetical protein
LLRSIAVSSNPIAYSAIGFLETSMGAEGREILHTLYTDSLVTERYARSALERLATRYSWK